MGERRDFLPARHTWWRSSSISRSRYLRRVVLLAAGLRAAEQRTDAQRQLLERERLGHVVVAAADEAGDAVILGVAGGQEDHRDEVAVCAQPAADLEAVDVGQHHVEHDEVGWRCPGRLRARPCRSARCVTS